MNVLLDPTARPVIGHRGNCAHAPENTLESFRQAASLGVDALEFDVRLTRDGEVVVFHDAALLRTTGAPGLVADCTLDHLRRLDAGATFSRDGGVSHPYRARGIGISTLAEVLDAIPALPVLIEIKLAAAAGPTRRVIERAGAEARCVVGSFRSEALTPFVGSRIAMAASPAMVASRVLPALLGRRYRKLPFQAMSLPTRYHALPVPIGALARAARPAGVALHVWTVNDAAEARRLWGRGANGILSDDPAVILDARRLLPDRQERHRLQ